MATSPVTPADTAEIAPAPTDRACDTVSKFVLALTQWDAWINFAVNGDGTATQNFLDWIGTGAGTTAGQLNAPTGLSASTTRTSDVTVTWLSVSGASSYSVYRGTTSDTGAMTLLSANQSDITFVDTGAVVGQVYYYAVRAYSGTQISAMSAAVSGQRVSGSSSEPTTVTNPNAPVTVTVPSGKTAMEVFLFGGGGSGNTRYGSVGGAGGWTVSFPQHTGGGGGSGSYLHLTSVPVVAGETYVLVAGGSDADSYVYKTALGSGTYAKARAGSRGIMATAEANGTGGAGGVAGTNALGGGSIAANTVGNAGSGTTGGAALSDSGLSAGAGGNGSDTYTALPGSTGLAKVVFT